MSTLHVLYQRRLARLRNGIGRPFGLSRRVVQEETPVEFITELVCDSGDNDATLQPPSPNTPPDNEPEPVDYPPWPLGPSRWTREDGLARQGPTHEFINANSSNDPPEEGIPRRTLEPPSSTLLAPPPSTSYPSFARMQPRIPNPPPTAPPVAPPCQSLLAPPLPSTSLPARASMEPGMSTPPLVVTTSHGFLAPPLPSRSLPARASVEPGLFAPPTHADPPLLEGAAPTMANVEHTNKSSIGVSGIFQRAIDRVKSIVNKPTKRRLPLAPPHVAVPPRPEPYPSNLGYMVPPPEMPNLNGLTVEEAMAAAIAYLYEVSRTTKQWIDYTRSERAETRAYTEALKRQNDRTSALLANLRRINSSVASLPLANSSLANSSLANPSLANPSLANPSLANSSLESLE